MKALFVDTACWMALADENDASHSSSRRARDDWMKEGGFLVSTDYIMDETLTLIRMRLGMDAAARWWDQVDSSSRLRWEWIDAARAEKAQTWFFRWRDKHFPLRIARALS